MEETRNAVDIEEENNYKDEQEIKVGTQVGEMAPDFVLQGLSGELVSLSQLRGKNVVLNFWALWCPYCIIEMPDLNEFHNSNKDEGFVVIGVNLGDNEKDVKSFADDKDIGFPILLDSFNETVSTYRIGPIPVTYFIDSEGIIYYKKIGAMKLPEIESIAKGLE